MLSLNNKSNNRYFCETCETGCMYRNIINFVTNRNYKTPKELNPNVAKEAYKSLSEIDQTEFDVYDAAKVDQLLIKKCGKWNASCMNFPFVGEIVEKPCGCNAKVKCTYFMTLDLTEEGSCSVDF